MAGVTGRAAMAALLAAILVGATAIGAAAQACPCATPASAQAIAQATAIFVAKVLATAGDVPGNPTRQNGQWRNPVDQASVTSATMQVETVLKGRVDKLTTVLTPTVCGYPFAAGGTYLVFAARNSAGLWTDACKGNASGSSIAARAAEVRRALAPPTRD